MRRIRCYRSAIDDAAADGAANVIANDRHVSTSSEHNNAANRSTY